MRLTLRTLLAYLDDVLEPTQAKELGQKIDESPLAAAMVGKVREVLRKRRLDAPKLRAWDHFNPNDVAEYLDNVLPIEKYREFEEKCVDSQTANSEERLAEVAACHQILTLILGKPVEVREQSRERMYSVIENAVAATEEPPSALLSDVEDTAMIATYQIAEDKDASSNSSSSIKQQSAGANQSQSNTPQPVSHTSPFDEDIPSSIRSQSGSSFAKLIPVIAITALCLLSIGSFFYGPALFGTGSTETKQQLALNQPGDNKLPQSDTPLETPSDKTPSGEKPAETTPNTVPPKTTNQTDPKDGTTPSTVPPIKVPDSKMPKTPDDKEPTKEPMKEPVKPIKPVEPALPIAKIEYQFSKGILLRKEATAEEWFVSPDRTSFRPGDDIVSPQPFRSTLNFPQLSISVEMDGGSSVHIPAPTKQTPAGLSLVRGRLIVKHHLLNDNPLFEDDAKADDDKKIPLTKLAKPVSFGLTLRDGKLWTIEILEAGTVFGIESVPRLPHQFENTFGHKLYSARLIVAKGSVRISSKTVPAKTIEAEGQFAMATPAANAVAGMGDKTTDPLGEDWILANPATRTVSRRKTALSFSREFTASEPIRLTLPAVANDPRPRISELAIKALAAVNHYEDLVQALSRGKHEESRQAAIEGLREWLPQSPDNRAILKKELAKVFEEETANSVYHLLWGYNKEDATDPERSKILVGWLTHNHVAVRELAIGSLRELTGRDYGYKPLNAQGKRRAAMTQWIKHLEREDGALIKLDQPKPDAEPVPKKPDAEKPAGEKKE